MGKEYKWHYFDTDSPLCIYEPLYGALMQYTACGMKLWLVHRHTEFKTKVDCLNCLCVLNKSKKEVTDDLNDDGQPII